MSIKPQSHILTDEDISGLQAKSWNIHYTTGLNIAEFVNACFANFNLTVFLEQIDQVLAPHCTSGVVRTLKFETSPPKIWIHYYSVNKDLAFIREFFYEDGHIQVAHALFILPPASRNKGIAKIVFQSSLQQYVNLNVDRIHVYAALETGGYIWAKHGFTARFRQEMNVIISNAKIHLNETQFQFVQRIYLNYYNVNPEGCDFPIIKWAGMPYMKEVLLGSKWHGSIDLHNTQQFGNFISYVFR
jgi:hypothetical protein